MCAESTGDVRAVSDKGALGLMQVMPATYAELRARHRLSADMFYPRDNILAGSIRFYPRDNILAGTANMCETRDRFGSPDFLAACHAGPRLTTTI